MGYLKEKVSYLKGLADGMQVSDSSNEGKLLKAIIDVLDDMALTVEELEETQDQLSEQVDEIDEDLSQVEDVLFDEEDEDECGCDGGCLEIECPYCNEKFEVDVDALDTDDNIISCPECGKDIEYELECDCDECSDDEE